MSHLACFLYQSDWNHQQSQPSNPECGILCFSLKFEPSRTYDACQTRRKWHNILFSVVVLGANTHLKYFKKNIPSHLIWRTWLLIAHSDRSMAIMLPILITSLIHFSSEAWENILFELGSESIDFLEGRKEGRKGGREGGREGGRAKKVKLDLLGQLQSECAPSVCNHSCHTCGLQHCTGMRWETNI